MCNKDLINKNKEEVISTKDYIVSDEDIQKYIEAGIYVDDGDN